MIKKRFICIVFIIVISSLNCSSYAYAGKYSNYVDTETLETDVKSIGLIVVGVDNSGSLNARYKTEIVFERFDGHKHSNNKRLVVMSDGNWLTPHFSSYPGNDFLSFDSKYLYAANGFPDKLALTLAKQGYNVTVLNYEYIFKEYKFSQGKSVAETLDFTRKSFPELDAVLFAFYRIYGATYEGVLLRGVLVMYDLKEGERQIYRYKQKGEVSMRSLSKDKVKNEYSKSLFGFNVLDGVRYRPTDVIDQYIKQIRDRIIEDFPKKADYGKMINNRTSSAVASFSNLRGQTYPMSNNSKTGTEIPLVRSSTIVGENGDLNKKIEEITLWNRVSTTYGSVKLPKGAKVRIPIDRFVAEFKANENGDLVGLIPGAYIGIKFDLDDVTSYEIGQFHAKWGTDSFLLVDDQKGYFVLDGEKLKGHDLLTTRGWQESFSSYCMLLHEGAEIDIRGKDIFIKNGTAYFYIPKDYEEREIDSEYHAPDVNTYYVNQKGDIIPGEGTFQIKNNKAIAKDGDLRLDAPFIPAEEG
ncbi:MAG: hypothetical protein WBD04_00385 [Candidatus Omnitrophota bacterium]